MFFKGQYRNIFVKYRNSDIFGKKVYQTETTCKFYVPDQLL